MISKTFSKLNARNKIIVITAIFVACGLSLLYFVIMPAVSDIKDLKRKIIDQKIELEQRVARGANAKQVNENLNKIEPQLQKFEQIFVNQGRDLEFITALEGIADKNNVEQKIGLGQPTGQENKTYKKIPLELTASGKYDDLLNYLADLESSNYYLNINFLEFGGSQSAAANSLKISADTYWK